MKSPKISVVVPVYNTEEYLAQCIGTIVDQTFRDIEIICVNDGSTDGSLNILNEYAGKDDRVIVVDCGSSSGSAALPRNIGLEKAKGKYVMFLDSDDYFDITMLEKLYARVLEADADLVMCDNYKVFFGTDDLIADGTELYHDFLPELEIFSCSDMPDTIFQFSSSAVWDKLILRETLIRNSLTFQLDTPTFDDTYFVTLLIVMSKRITVVFDKLIFYRMTRIGAQTTQTKKNKCVIFKAIEAIIEYLTEHSLYDKVKFSLQNMNLSLMKWWMNTAGDYDTFYELYCLYKNEYFEKFELMNIAPETLYSNLGKFYNEILNKPPLVEVLECLEPGGKIAVYGAGFCGNNVYKLIKTNGKHDVSVWVDRNAGRLNNSLVKPPEELLKVDFDALFISILNADIAGEVKQYLIEMGVDARKIYEV